MISEKAVVARAKADSTVNGLIFGRIFPDEAPADNVRCPRIVYWADSADTGGTYDGPDGLANEKITLSCEDVSPSGARALADLVRTSFDGLSGTIGGTVVQGMFFEDERSERYEEAAENGLRIVYARELDFLIWFET